MRYARTDRKEFEFILNKNDYIQRGRTISSPKNKTPSYLKATNTAINGEAIQTRDRGPNQKQGPWTASHNWTQKPPTQI